MSVKDGLDQTSKTILNVQYNTSYTYDEDGKLATITYPSGRVVSYVRDNMGRVTSIMTGGGLQVVAQNITRLPFGPIDSLNHGNGLSLSRTYNQDYWLSGQTVGTILNLGYTRNNIGNISAITDNLNALNSQSFGFDNLHRLTSATGNYGTLTYTYDAVGNRLTKTLGGLTDTYTYNTGTNQIAAITGQNPETFTHDANGNITARANTVLTYNQNQRLIRAVVGGAQQTDYVVNGMGRRAIKTTSTSVTVYHYDFKGKLIAETDDTGTLIKEYIWLGRRLMAAAESSGFYHVHNSHRLEPLKVSNSSGVVVWDATSQKPYGGTSVDEDPDNNQVNFKLNVRLPGQYYDAETGHHYNYFREYYPGVGRYLQADPIGLAGGLNLYAYAGSDPVNGTDLTGLTYTNLSDEPQVAVLESGQKVSVPPNSAIPSGIDGIMNPDGSFTKTMGKDWFGGLLEASAITTKNKTHICYGVVGWITYNVPPSTWPSTNIEPAKNVQAPSTVAEVIGSIVDAIGSVFDAIGDFFGGSDDVTDTPETDAEEHGDWGEMGD